MADKSSLNVFAQRSGLGNSKYPSDRPIRRRLPHSQFVALSNSHAGLNWNRSEEADQTSRPPSSAAMSSNTTSAAGAVQRRSVMAAPAEAFEETEDALFASVMDQFEASQSAAEPAPSTPEANAQHDGATTVSHNNASAASRIRPMSVQRSDTASISAAGASSNHLPSSRIGGIVSTQRPSQAPTADNRSVEGNKPSYNTLAGEVSILRSKLSESNNKVNALQTRLTKTRQEMETRHKQEVYDMKKRIEDLTAKLEFKQSEDMLFSTYSSNSKAPAASADAAKSRSRTRSSEGSVPRPGSAMGQTSSKARITPTKLKSPPLLGEGFFSSSQQQPRPTKRAATDNDAAQTKRVKSTTSASAVASPSPNSGVNAEEMKLAYARPRRGVGVATFPWRLHSISTMLLQASAISSANPAARGMPISGGLSAARAPISSSDSTAQSPPFIALDPELRDLLQACVESGDHDERLLRNLVEHLVAAIREPASDHGSVIASQPQQPADSTPQPHARPQMGSRQLQAVALLHHVLATESLSVRRCFDVRAQALQPSGTNRNLYGQVRSELQSLGVSSLTVTVWNDLLETSAHFAASCGSAFHVSGSDRREVDLQVLAQTLDLCKVAVQHGADARNFGDQAVQAALAGLRAVRAGLESASTEPKPACLSHAMRLSELGNGPNGSNTISSSRVSSRRALDIGFASAICVAAANLLATVASHMTPCSTADARGDRSSDRSGAAHAADQAGPTAPLEVPSTWVSCLDELVFILRHTSETAPLPALHVLRVLRSLSAFAGGVLATRPHWLVLKQAATHQLANLALYHLQEYERTNVDCQGGIDPAPHVHQQQYTRRAVVGTLCRILFALPWQTSEARSYALSYRTSLQVLGLRLSAFIRAYPQQFGEDFDEDVEDFAHMYSSHS